MTTPRTRAIVSRSLALTVTLALGACARNPSPVAWDGPTVLPERLRTVRFDNEAQESVHVYLIGEQREWLLGRVEPGARATLRLPAASLAPTSGFLRIAVLAGAPLSVQAARDPRAAFTIAQPASSILSQRWTFSRRQLASPEVLGVRANIGRP